MHTRLGPPLVLSLVACGDDGARTCGEDHRELFPWLHSISTITPMWRYRYSGQPGSEGHRIGFGKIPEVMGWSEEAGIEVVPLWMLSSRHEPDILKQWALSLLDWSTKLDPPDARTNTLASFTDIKPTGIGTTSANIAAGVRSR